MKDYEVSPRTTKLTGAQVDMCIRHMIRCADLFALSSRELKATDFDSSSEMYYALVWSAALSVAERNGGVLPTAGIGEIINVELNAKIQQAGSSIVEEVAKSSRKLLSWIYKTPDTDLDPEYHRSLIRDLIIERRIVKSAVTELQQAQSLGRPGNLPERLQSYVSSLQSVMLNPTAASKSAFPKEIKVKPLNRFTTGIRWLDRFMGGGQVGGEVYAILGPTGLGKTTLGIMLAVESARYWSSQFKQGLTDKKKISHFVTWEQSHDQVMYRIWAYAATIDAKSIEMAAVDTNPEPLSTKGNLKPYELILFAEQIKQIGMENIPGESERLSAASEELEDFLRIADFSGNDPDNSKAGENGVLDVAELVRAVNSDGYATGIVVLDYAVAAIRRMMGSKNIKPENVRHYLADWGNQCRFKIANPADCPVWVLQQQNPEANKRSPTMEQTHNTSSECGTFAENMWYVFCFGTKDHENNVTRCWCSKSRRSAGDIPAPILSIEGNFCRFKDVSDQFTADSQLRRFVRKDMAKQYIDPAQARRTKTKDLGAPWRPDW